MKDPISRRGFVGTAIATGIALPGALAQTQQTPAQDAAVARPPRPAALAPELVNEFVRVAHADFTRVKEMLGAQPGLLNATWDWGAGDFETALGAAGHMGRKDIALWLIEQGARMDIFVAAMLGRRAILEPTLAAYPHLIHSKGPHGISLLRHALAGGAENKEIAAWLESLGAK